MRPMMLLSYDDLPLRHVLGLIVEDEASWLSPRVALHMFALSPESVVCYICCR